MLKLEAGRYLGRRDGEIAAGGCVVSEAHYDAGLRLPEHAHQNGHFCFAIEGACTEWWEGRPHERAGAVLVWIPAGVGHAEHHHSVGRHLHIEVPVTALSRFADAEPCLERPAVLPHAIAIDLATRLQRELASSDDLSALSIEGCVLELLAETARAARSPGPAVACSPVESALELLRARLADPPTLTALAAEVGVDRAHLARSFRRHLKRTVGEEIRRQRMALACRRLAEPGASIAEIAQQLGFADQAHFTRVFKAYLGKTPGRFRREAR